MLSPVSLFVLLATVCSPQQERAAAPVHQETPQQRYLDWTDLDFPAEEYRDRRERVATALRETGGGILLVPSSEGTSDGHTFRQEDDFLYLTGLEFPRSVLALDSEEGRAVVFAPMRDARFESASRRNDFPGRPLAADPAIADAAGIRIVPWGEFDRALASWLPGDKQILINPGRGGSLPDTRRRLFGRTNSGLELLAELRRREPDGNFASAYPAIARARMVKSTAELQRIRRACAITCESIAAAARHVAAGVTERDLEAELEAEFKRGGAQRIPFSSIIKSGPNSLWPWRILATHYDRRNRAMQTGDLVIFDVGCELDGYVTDIGRTFPASGRFTKFQRETLAMATAVADAIFDAIEPGVTLAELTRIAVEATPPEQRRYMQTGSFFGHHLGLSTGDPNLLDAPLQPGMVFTVEPWYYNHDEDIAVFVEDMVLVTREGAERLSAALPRSADELEQMIQPRDEKRN